MLGPYALFLYGLSIILYIMSVCIQHIDSQTNVQWSAAPHTWRNDSAELHERDTQQWGSKQVVHRCALKVKGTSKHGTYIGVQILKGIPFKGLWHTQFQYKVWWHLYYFCTACSGRHFWYYTPTQQRMYVHTHNYSYIHIYCIQVRSGAWTYVYVYIHERTYVSMHRGPWKCITYILVAWDVTLGHVGGLARESSTHTCKYSLSNNPEAHFG